MFTQRDLDSEVQRWFADGGDNRFRYKYDLNRDSVVFDAGAYIGKWSKQIYDLYHCKIYAFEPVREFYSIAKSDSIYDAINWFNFGLGDRNQEIEIVLDADGSSIYKKSGHKEKIQIKCFDSTIKYLFISTIDLLKINIEGGEYDLLDHVLGMNLQKSIGNIQVQFHINVPDYEKRRNIIRKTLSETHALTFDYPFVWENWKIIK
jgi:FkbM family methyltransferase